MGADSSRISSALRMQWLAGTAARRADSNDVLPDPGGPETMRLRRDCMTAHRNEAAACGQGAGVGSPLVPLHRLEHEGADLVRVQPRVELGLLDGIEHGVPDGRVSVGWGVHRRFIEAALKRALRGTVAIRVPVLYGS